MTKQGVMTNSVCVCVGGGGGRITMAATNKAECDIGWK